MIKTEEIIVEDFADKLMRGVNKALRKLVETSAANDESLIISDGNGNPESVPAKELLKRFTEK